MKNKKLPSIVVLLILTLITSVFWLTFSVYQAFTTKEPEEVPSNILEPINPTLDNQVINQIIDRKSVSQ